MMQEKLERLFKEINVEENMLPYFENANIDKIVIYDQNKLLEFILNTDKMIPVEIYNNILYKILN